MNVHCLRAARGALTAMLLLFLGVLSDAAAQEERTPADWASLRESSDTHLKEIGVALQNYHDVFKRFPPAYLSKDGKPLLSWRVTILPFLEENGLYQEFHRDEPWDSDHNKKLIERMPAVYRSPASNVEGPHTVYLTPRGAETAFPGERGTPIREIRDGTSRSIALIEADDSQAVIWTKPDDWTIDPQHAKVGFRGQYPQGAMAGFLDSSRRFISHDVDEGLLKALLTIDGREPIQLPD